MDGLVQTKAKSSILVIHVVISFVVVWHKRTPCLVVTRRHDEICLWSPGCVKNVVIVSLEGLCVFGSADVR